jgi:DNA replication protein DnaC
VEALTRRKRRHVDGERQHGRRGPGRAPGVPISETRARDHAVHQLERGEASALELIDMLLAEELSVRETSRIKTALRMGRLATIKTLSGFDFSFQPSLDRGRILALAELQFATRREVVHFLGPPGTGKSHLAVALGVEAVKAGRSVYFTTLADIVGALAKAEREGQLRERIRWFCRSALLIVDEIGYLPVIPGGGNYFTAAGYDRDIRNQVWERLALRKRAKSL